MSDGDLDIGFWELTIPIHRFWGCIRGLHMLVWGIWLGQEGRVLVRRMVQPRVGGVCRRKFEYGFAVNGFFRQHGG